MSLCILRSCFNLQDVLEVLAEDITVSRLSEHFKFVPESILLISHASIVPKYFYHDENGHFHVGNDNDLIVFADMNAMQECDNTKVNHNSLHLTAWEKSKVEKYLKKHLDIANFLTLRPTQGCYPKYCYTTNYQLTCEKKNIFRKMASLPIIMVAFQYLFANLVLSVRNIQS